MKKFLVETFYTCTFKTVHALEDLNEKALEKIDSRTDGQVELIDVKLNNRKTRKIGDSNKKNVKSKIEKSIKDSAPNAHIDGIMISPMKNGDIECILGAKIDPVFGPIVMFGLGGIYAEVMKDIVFAEAPVSKQKAEQMILSLKSKDIFYGARGKPPIEINSLLNAIINLSNFFLLMLKKTSFSNLPNM